MISSVRLTIAAVAFLACVLASGCNLSRELAPAPLALAGTSEDPVARIRHEQGSRPIHIMYVTDRHRVRDKAGNAVYGCGRSKSMVYGDCEVDLSRRVPFQNILVNSLLFRRAVSLPLAIGAVRELGRFPSTPPPLNHAAPPDNETKFSYAEDAYQTELAARLANSPRKEVLVFVHGYNITFPDAAFTLAEIHNMLGREFVPIAYTWPSGSGWFLNAYTRDRESGEFTNFHFKEFLTVTAATPGVERIHIICHSRGADVVTSALRELFGEAGAAGRDPREEFKIGHLALAAPDMDLWVVSQRVIAERVPEGVERTTFYVSPYDKALGFADWILRGVSRWGPLGRRRLTQDLRRHLDPPVAAMDIIQVRTKCRHSYFYSNPYVSSDLILLIGEDRPPGAEHGRPLTPMGRGMWGLYRGYPGAVKLPWLRRLWGAPDAAEPAAQTSGD